MREGFQRGGVTAALTAILLVGMPAGITSAQQANAPAATAASPPRTASTFSIVEPNNSLVVTPEPPDGWNKHPRPTLIENPTWARRPYIEFPEAALANRIGNGRVTLRCTVESTGALTDCSAIEEFPQGQGFAHSALMGTRDARISPRLVDGAAIRASVQFTINYRMPIDDPVIIEASPKR